MTGNTAELSISTPLMGRWLRSMKWHPRSTATFTKKPTRQCQFRVRISLLPSLDHSIKTWGGMVIVRPRFTIDVGKLCLTVNCQLSTMTVNCQLSTMTENCQSSTMIAFFLPWVILAYFQISRVTCIEATLMIISVSPRISKKFLPLVEIHPRPKTAKTPRIR